MAGFRSTDSITAPLAIRGHTLLCLQGFRGRGYDARFIAEMTAVCRHLATFPDTPVRLLAAADRFCAVCPHRKGAGCHLKGADSEREVAAQDHLVLSLLGFEVGTIVTWRTILKRIAERIMPDRLPWICGACPWLPLGDCREGIERLCGPRGSSGVRWEGPPRHTKDRAKRVRMFDGERAHAVCHSRKGGV